MIESDAKKLLLDYQSRQSDFQIEQFIVGQHVSDWAKYQQCLHEIDGHISVLIDLREQLELQKLNFNSFNLLAFFSKKHRQIQKIKRKKKIRQYFKTLENAKKISDELAKFVEIGLKLRDSIGKLGPVNSQKRKKLEADSWFQKAHHMASIDLMVSGGISKNTMEFILHLPENEKVKLLNNIRNNLKEISVFQGSA